MCVCVCVRVWSFTLCSFLQSPINSSLLGQNIFHSTTVSNTRRLRSSLNARDHTKPQNYIGLHILIVTFFDGQQEKILDWAADIQSLSNAQVIPQKPSSTHDQLRRPKNLLLKQLNSFSFSFSLTSSSTTTSLSPTIQRRLYDKWWTVSAWKEAGMA
jgi:hypothetical protein